MSFLLDTNVVSEWTKPQPNSGVIDWLAQTDEDSVFLSVVTFAELRHGIERLPPSKRRDRLDEWLKVDLPLRFEQRILPVDAAIADQWGHLVARCEAAGRPIHAMDALLAATAEAHALTLVTRNAADFAATLKSKSILNPWK
jgi:toxin FitB